MEKVVKLLEDAELRARETLAEARRDLADLEASGLSGPAARPTWFEDVRTLLLALRENSAAASLPLPAQQAASALLERVAATESEDLPAEPVLLTERLNEPLESEVRRCCFGRRRAWKTATESADSDDPEAEEDAMDESRGVKRTLPADDGPAKGQGKGEDVAAWSTPVLEQRLSLCQQQHASALERRNYSEANTLSGMMSEFVQELQSRTKSEGE